MPYFALPFLGGSPSPQAFIFSRQSLAGVIYKKAWINLSKISTSSNHARFFPLSAQSGGGYVITTNRLFSAHPWASAQNSDIEKRNSTLFHMVFRFAKRHIYTLGNNRL
jgi:hypothetical protein